MNSNGTNGGEGMGGTRKKRKMTCNQELPRKRMKAGVVWYLFGIIRTILSTDSFNTGSIRVWFHARYRTRGWFQFRKRQKG